MRFPGRPIPALSPVLVLSALLTGCGGDGSGPVTVSSITAPGGTSLVGTVGQSIAIQVTVTGSNGNPYAGGVVSFSVTSGGGSVAPATANTSQSGQASTTWTLGTTTGTQGLSASIEGASVSFTADVGAGMPSSVEAVTTFPGQFTPGQPLPQPATFVVRDQYNNGVPGVSVTFQASDGGAANPAQATTGSDGRASTTWTLGASNGLQTLSATVAGVAPVSVSADAFDPCFELKPHTLGQTSSGTLTAQSCELLVLNKLRFTDVYSFTLNTSGAWRFTIQSDFTEPTLLLLDPGGVAGRTTAGRELVVKTLLDNGTGSKTYFPWIAGGPGAVGDYDFSSASISAAMNGCETWVATKNVTTSQQLAASDCPWVDGTDVYYVDYVEVWLEVGETIIAEMTSPNWDVLDPWIDLWQYNEVGDQIWIWGNDDAYDGTLDSRLEYTITEENGAGFYQIGPTSFDPLQVGPYTLTISSGGGAASPALQSPEGYPFRLFPFAQATRPEAKDTGSVDRPRIARRK